MSDSLARWRELEDAHCLATYAKFPLALERGEGVYVFDTDGNRYLDFYGGHAVALIGHCHPRLVQALTAQINALVFYSNLVYLPIRAQAVEALRSVLYPEMARVFLVNSGAEANEGALKLARAHTGRARIVAMENSFHGRTIAALSVTGMAKHRNAFTPNLSAATDFVPFGDMAALERIDPQTVAAVITEPIQSMAGVVTAPPEYFQALRAYTRAHGIQLIFDEIQTAIGRTGRTCAGMHWGVAPDIMTMAKGIAGGIPIGAVAVTEAIASGVKVNDHGTTFGGGPVACAALKATIEVIAGEDLVAHAADMGALLRAQLAAVPAVKDVRGMGLLVGFTAGRPARDIQRALLERGILAGTSVDPAVVRLLPPLTIGAQDVAALITALKEICQ